jgi:hypothetical protein
VRQTTGAPVSASPALHTMEATLDLPVR